MINKALSDMYSNTHFPQNGCTGARPFSTWTARRSGTTLWVRSTWAACEEPRKPAEFIVLVVVYFSILSSTRGCTASPRYREARQREQCELAAGCASHRLSCNLIEELRIETARRLTWNGSPA